jgi:hypothetical protein
MVTANGYAPKLGLAVPRTMENADCMLWVQVCSLLHFHEMGV